MSDLLSQLPQLGEFPHSAWTLRLTTIWESLGHPSSVFFLRELCMCAIDGVST